MPSSSDNSLNPSRGLPHYNLKAPGALALVREILLNGTVLKIRVTGPSMGGALSDGDVVCIKAVGPQGPRRGDIVLYANQDAEAVLHRVLRVGGQNIHAAGDALITLEGPLDRSAVIGRVVSAEKPSGRTYDLDTPVQRLRASIKALGRLMVIRAYGVIASVRRA